MIPFPHQKEKIGRHLDDPIGERDAITPIPSLASPVKPRRRHSSTNNVSFNTAAPASRRTLSSLSKPAMRSVSSSSSRAPQKLALETDHLPKLHNFVASPRSSRISRSRLSIHSDRSKSSRILENGSESGVSVISHFTPFTADPLRKLGQDELIHSKRPSRKTSSSPLRSWVKWMTRNGMSSLALPIAILFIVLVKTLIGLGNYSGQMTPPLRGDFEAQRHWLALTSSSLGNTFPNPPSEETVSSSRWYFRDLQYWGLDYPPLTAYHSFILGAIARLSSHTAPFVTLRPLDDGNSTIEIDKWSKMMDRLEEEGDMKAWMRATLLWTDIIIYVSAVLMYCRKNYWLLDGEKGVQTMVVTSASILLQPALLLIDSGHFQYNSAMLGFTLWSIVLFQSNHHLLGALAFVCSLGFKQMALYYSPAIFAYLLGRCLWIDGRPGVAFFLRLGAATVASFMLVFLPFLHPTSLGQVLYRIFPFARGLFEDKVANFWCAVNVVIKLRDVFSITVLTRLALVSTLLAVLPSVLGIIYLGYSAGKNEKNHTSEERVSLATPTTILLPHSLFISSMAFFLFSFQVHEKSILLPLMPLTVLIGCREVGYGRLDWEWAVLLNNVGVFSMWPLLKRDGLGLQYLTLTFAWNYVIGYNPFLMGDSFIKLLSLGTYGGIGFLHLIELIAQPPAHLPDLFTVLNLTLSFAVFWLGFLWATKRVVQEGWSISGLQGGLRNSQRRSKGSKAR